MKRGLLFALLLTFGLVLSACGNTGDGDGGGSDEPQTLTYSLVDTAYADISGDVEFEELDNGDIQATIDLGDTAADGASYPAHIHAGDAGSGGGIVVPLNDVVDGTSVTVFSELTNSDESTTGITFAELRDYDGYVNVHLPDNLSIVVASANIGANADVEVPVPGTIAEVAEGAENFSILLSALTEAELAATFADADGGPFTVLAPTDEAFASLLEELGVTAEELLARDDLADILQYHVVEGAVPESEVVAAATAGSDVPTLLEDDPISLSLEGETVVIDDRANVTATNIVASNGLIHQIDTVLLPESLTGEEPEVTTVEVELSGENEVPAVETDFEGSATVTLDGTTLSVTGSYSEAMVIAGPGAHVHGPASATENADVLFSLTFDNDANSLTGEFDLSAGASANEETYTEAQLLEFFASGQLYINLHTEANPSGEIRGQITPDSEPNPEEED